MIVLPNGAVIPDQAMANARATDEVNLRNRQLVNVMMAEQMRNKRAMEDMAARERMTRLQQEATERMSTARLGEVALDRQARERIETGRQGVDRDRISAAERASTAGRQQDADNALMHILGQAYLNAQIRPEQRAGALDLLDRYKKQQDVASRAKKVLSPENFTRSVMSAARSMGAKPGDEKEGEIIGKAVKRVRDDYAKRFGDSVDFSESFDAPETLADLETFYMSGKNKVPLQVLKIEVPKIVSSIADSNPDVMKDLPSFVNTVRSIIGNQHVDEAKRVAGQTVKPPAGAAPSTASAPSVPGYSGGPHPDDDFAGDVPEGTYAATPENQESAAAPDGGGGSGDGEEAAADPAAGEEVLLYGDGEAATPTAITNIAKNPMPLGVSIPASIGMALAPWMQDNMRGVPQTGVVGMEGSNYYPGATYGFSYQPATALSSAPVQGPRPSRVNRYTGRPVIDENERAAAINQTASFRDRTLVD